MTCKRGSPRSRSSRRPGIPIWRYWPAKRPFLAGGARPLGRRLEQHGGRSESPSSCTGDGDGIGEVGPIGGGGAPGGNRTRGLRLERPLLFGSPKRTVDH